MAHKLQIKGSIALIHAVSAFVIDWQKKHGKEDYNIQKDSFADQAIAAGPDPFAQTLPETKVGALNGMLTAKNPDTGFDPSIHSGNQGSAGAWGNPAPSAAPVEEKKAAKPRASRAKQKEETAAPVAAPATPAPDIALPDWLQNATAPVNPAAQPWLGAPAPASPIIAGVPLSHEDPFAPVVPAAPVFPPVQPVIPVAQMPAPEVHKPVLTQIVEVMNYIANDQAKRNLTSQYLASKGFSSIEQLPVDQHIEALSILTQIANGQIK